MLQMVITAALTPVVNGIGPGSGCLSGLMLSWQVGLSDNSRHIVRSSQADSPGRAGATCLHLQNCRL